MHRENSALATSTDDGRITSSKKTEKITKARNSVDLKVFQKPYSDLAPDVENQIFWQITTNLIGFQPLKIGFFGIFDNGARSQLTSHSFELGNTIRRNPRSIPETSAGNLIISSTHKSF